MVDEAELEREVRTLVIDNDLPAKLDAMRAEGWELAVAPVAIYHVVRQKNRPTDAQLRMQIDDSKIGILRANGKFE